MKTTAKFLLAAAGLAALAGPLGLRAGTAGMLPLYTANHLQMYAYAYPSPGSTITPQKADGRYWMDLSLKGDAWSGAGIGMDMQDLSAWVAKGALQFWARAPQAGTDFQIGFVQAKGFRPGQLAFQVTLPVGSYARLTPQWTKVVIPLADFPRQGSRFDDKTQQSVSGTFDWTRVQEVVVARAPGGPGQVRFSLADINLLPSYNPASLPKMPAAQAASGEVDFYAGAMATGGYTYAYPEGKAQVKEAAGGYHDAHCLESDLITSAWSGGAIGRDPVDLSRLHDDGGTLRAWVKGQYGGEVIALGFTDKTHGGAVRLNIGPYLKGGSMDRGQWKQVVIPLSAFPSQGQKWDEAKQQNETFPFDWKNVQEVMWDNDGPGKMSSSFFIDGIKVMPKGK